MASTNKTPRLGLSQWEAGDAFSREDLNGDLLKVDEAASGTWVKLMDTEFQTATKVVELNLSEIDMSLYAELVMALQIANRNFCMRVNGETYNYYYYDSDSENMSSRAYMPVRNVNSYIYLIGSRLVHRNDAEIRSDLMFGITKLDTLQFYMANDVELTRAGDRITIWGVRK